MKRIEPTANGAPYVILNIYDDDHRRNLMACRWVHISRFYSIEGNEAMFHNMPWVHVRFDLSTDKWIEQANPFDTSESLYQLCDPSFMYETYRHDPVAKLEMLRHGAQVDDVRDVFELADHFRVNLDLSTPESSQRTSWELLMEYSLRSTMFVVDQARQFLASQGKKLMVLLSYGSGNVQNALMGKPRFDQSLVEYLKGTGLTVVDTLTRHVDDYKSFRVSPEDYCKRYYIGHYNPAGNHFFTFAIKNALIDWLDPKPVTYSSEDVSIAESAAKLD
jgi:hypothetical protein